MKFTAFDYHYQLGKNLAVFTIIFSLFSEIQLERWLKRFFTPRIESKNFEEVLLNRRIAVSGELHLLYVLHESFSMSSCPASFVEEFA